MDTLRYSVLKSLSGIYGFFNKTNGHCYVGSAVSLYWRKHDHLKVLRKSTSQCSRFQNAWNKYGEKNFCWCVIEFVPDKTQLIAREQFWIDALGAHAEGYNTAPTAGSTLGRACSPETRAKLSAALKGRKSGPVSEEKREKMSAAQKGRIITPEAREKIAQTLKGRRPPQKAVDRAREVNTGKKRPAEVLAIMAENNRIRWQKYREAKRNGSSN